MPADLATVTTAAILARRPCRPPTGTRSEQLSALCRRYRRERWSALEILSLDEVPAEDRLWVCLHDSLVPDRVLVRFACEVDAAWDARDAARDAACAAQIRLLRTLILLDLDGYDVLRGELCGVVPRKGAA